ncbi:hypothetical protein CBNA_0708 [Coxiella burnetii str. Namibia]|nr:hypothetical protein CBNA_0708 [Coxiella burnetii str. Namibia]
MDYFNTMNGHRFCVINLNENGKEYEKSKNTL